MSFSLFLSFMCWIISVILSGLNSVDILPTCGAANQTQMESHPLRICSQTSFCACLSGSSPSSFASETSSSSVCGPVLLQRINITPWPSNPSVVSPLYIKHECDKNNMQHPSQPHWSSNIQSVKIHHVFLTVIHKNLWLRQVWLHHIRVTFLHIHNTIN